MESSSQISLLISRGGGGEKFYIRLSLYVNNTAALKRGNSSLILSVSLTGLETILQLEVVAPGFSPFCFSVFFRELKQVACLHSGCNKCSNLIKVMFTGFVFFHCEKSNRELGQPFALALSFQPLTCIHFYCFQLMVSLLVKKKENTRKDRKNK